MAWKSSHRQITFGHIFSLLFLVPLLLLQHASAEYQRPAPRELVITPHERSDSDPQQVHISLAGKDHIRVSWITNDDDIPSIVEYGTKPGLYDASATGENTSYTFLIYKSGTIHNVRIGPLHPKTTYYYRCGGQSQEFSLVTPPSTYPIEFAIVGDLGQTGWTKSTLSQLSKKDYDVFLLPGDLAYADGLQPLWDSFGRLVEPYASQRPWMVTEGNHEVESIPIIYPFSFKAYNARWQMPSEESGSSSNLYYSFDVVGTHVIMLGSYADFDADSDQYKWLEADLGKVDRTVTPWLIVLLHDPWKNFVKRKV
uniref:Purple acid phosphatase n=1 Tax=Kalanchoe fedtschenkoi TaxID=63787 RepID=A0A7N1A129_KALFE